jgi:Spy/CpxP family protein refolding chaperone
MRSIRNIVVATTVATAALVLAMPAAAQAKTGSGNEFGQHVHMCAQMMGFSGSHNPGMHQGNAGWDGMPCACASE